MTNPTQGVSVRRTYYGSGTPPVLPVFYDDQYDANPNTDVLDPVLQYDGARGVIGYTWDGTRQVEDGDNDPIGDALRATAIVYYKAENTTDSTENGNTLTNTNSVTFTPGKISNAFTFNGTNQRLSAASNLGLKISAGQSFTWVLWVKLNTKATPQGFIAKLDQDDTGIADYCIYYNQNTDLFEFLTANDSQAPVVGADTFGSPSTGTWYMLVCEYDHTDLLTGQKISVNNGVFDESVHVDLTGTDFDLWVGNDGYYSGPLNGLVDEAGMWKQLLTPEQLAYLYNSGAGRTLYP